MGPLKLTPVAPDQLFSGGTFDTAETLTVPAGAQVALLSPHGTDARWRDAGVAPTTTVGQVVKADTSYEYWGDLNTIQVIAVTPGGSMAVSYYKIAG